MRTRSGGCLCGAVRYLLRGEPYRYGICHCADCRKESGGVFVVYAHWRRDDAEVSGPFKTYKGRSFCATCGSRLFNLHADDIEVRVGSLDQAPTTLGAPAREGWIKRLRSGSRLSRARTRTWKIRPKAVRPKCDGLQGCHYRCIVRPQVKRGAP